MTCLSLMSFFFFFNDTATTEIYTLSLHDALPISAHQSSQRETDPVTSWKSASGTPFATKRGAQWEIAASTRESFSVLLWMTADISAPNAEITGGLANRGSIALTLVSGDLEAVSILSYNVKYI